MTRIATQQMVDRKLMVLGIVALMEGSQAAHDPEGGSGKGCPVRVTLERVLGLSSMQVRWVLKCLVEEGMLICEQADHEGRGRASNAYRLTEAAYEYARSQA